MSGGVGLTGELQIPTSWARFYTVDREQVQPGLSALDLLLRCELPIIGEGVPVISVCPWTASSILPVMLNDGITYQVKRAWVPHKEVFMGHRDIHHCIVGSLWKRGSFIKRIIIPDFADSILESGSVL